MWTVLHMIKAWQDALRNMFSGYRPELYYMRGPGPKWLEKHPNAAVVPVRVRARR